MRRISLPICIASGFAVVVVTWWLGTRSRDFTSPPSEAELAEIRLMAARTNPTAQGLGDALTPVGKQEQEGTPIPVVLPRHVNRAPQLDDYLDEVNKGPGYLMELAKLLGEEHPERALTCWERVIDSCKADEDQKQRAERAIIKLKKSTTPWNEKPGDGLPVLIQVGTGPSAAAQLDPILKELSQLLSTSSSGVIRVTTKISTGAEDMIDNGKSPVAMWMSGPEEDDASTDVVSFFIPVDSAEGLQDMLETEVYRIIRHHLKQMDGLQPLPKPSGQNLSEGLLNGRITRLSWQKLGKSLGNTL